MSCESDEQCAYVIPGLTKGGGGVCTSNRNLSTTLGSIFAKTAVKYRHVTLRTIDRKRSNDGKRCSE